jgi:hypothetical protein
MEASGSKAINYIHTILKSKDIIIVPNCNTNVKLPSEDSVFETGAFKYDQFPLAATMSDTLGADFYASGWGPLPYALGKAGSEDYFIYQVK